MKGIKSIKRSVLALLMLFCVMFSGFSYQTDETNAIKPDGRIITLKYLQNDYLLNIVDFFSIKAENQTIEINEQVLRDKIKETALRIDQPAQDARITDEKTFMIQKETDGICVDQEQLIKLVSDYLQSGSIIDNFNIEIPVVIVKPEITEEILNRIKENEISSFSTKYYPYQKDRTENLRISTEKLNGTIVYPGEIFSMDNTLGERTVEKGYKYAPIFSGGKVIKGLAGGICQTTTTTYNAALLANLQIVERYRHGLSVTYVPKGRDAAISRNNQDLKFKNNTGYPIYIKAGIDNKKGLLTVKIYGFENNYKVKITSEHKTKNKKVYYMTYRQLFDKTDKLIKKELVSTDIF